MTLTVQLTCVLIFCHKLATFQAIDLSNKKRNVWQIKAISRGAVGIEEKRQRMVSCTMSFASRFFHQGGAEG